MHKLNLIVDLYVYYISSPLNVFFFCYPTSLEKRYILQLKNPVAPWNHAFLNLRTNNSSLMIQWQLNLMVNDAKSICLITLILKNVDVQPYFVWTARGNRTFCHLVETHQIVLAVMLLARMVEQSYNPFRWIISGIWWINQHCVKSDYQICTLISNEKFLFF